MTQKEKLQSPVGMVALRLFCFDLDDTCTLHFVTTGMTHILSLINSWFSAIMDGKTLSISLKEAKDGGAYFQLRALKESARDTIFLLFFFKFYLYA